MRNRASKTDGQTFQKKKANAVWRKTNGQTFPKTAKCSLEKKRMGKHFEKKTKLILGKHKRTIQKKKKQMQFLEMELQKTNGQTLKKKQVHFGEK